MVPTPLLLRRFSDPRWRIATIASWRSARRRLCASDVARDDGLDADRLCELPQQVVAPCVAALVGPLELDEEAVASKIAASSAAPLGS